MSYLHGKNGPRVPPTFSDMLGQEVRVGDFVCYAVRTGNEATQKAGVVREITWHEKMDGGYYTWKVECTMESSYGTVARPRKAARWSEPNLGKMVRIAKGDQW